MKTPSYALRFCLIVLFTVPLGAQPFHAAVSSGRPCADAHIAFDVSSIEQILQRPADVLANADRFWKDDVAYSLTKQWHDRNNIPIAFDEWREALERIANARGEGSAESVKALVKAIADSGDEFLKKSLPLICSYLPDAKVRLDTTVYFTAYVRPRGFMMNDNIVINIAHPYWSGDRQHLLNAIAHEIFHIGYGRNPTSLALAVHTDDQFYKLLRPLQNEGMATYVGYKAIAIYPAAGEKDYELLASQAHVVELRRKLNALFEQAPSLTPDELQKRSWDVGVTERAYYIVGADMARTIELRSGRKVLAETITEGPRSFVKTYNTLVRSAERIVELP